MTYFNGNKNPSYGFQASGPWYDPVKGHTGCDYLMNEDTIITTPVSGIITKLLSQKEMGNVVYLKDAEGRIHVFAHLNTFCVEVGDTMKRDQKIAQSGNTGTATTAPHLHYEIIAPEPEAGNEHMTRSLAGYEGYNINPETFLKSLETAHWSDESMDWLLQHGIITERKNPDQLITWGEYAVCTQRLAEKIMEWTKTG